MEMSDEPALQILQPEGKNTDISACVICQSDDKASLRKAKKTSISNLIEAMQERNDHVFDRLKPDIPGLTTSNVYWHAICYSDYVSKHNIRHAPKRKLSVSPTPVSSDSLEATQSSSSHSRSSRSKQIPFDRMKCMFCQKVTRKKVKALVNVSTYMACKTILAAAEVRGDDRMLLILRGVNNDQCTAELKYHQSCHAVYTSMKSVNPTKPETGTGNSKTFDDLTAAIIPKLKAGKSYDMTSLLQNIKVFYKPKTWSRIVIRAKTLKKDSKIASAMKLSFISLLSIPSRNLFIPVLSQYRALSTRHSRGLKTPT